MTICCSSLQCDQKILKITIFLEKSSQNGCLDKKIYIKAQFESTNHLHQNTSETIKNTNIKPCFETATSDQKIQKMLSIKVGQIAATLG